MTTSKGVGLSLTQMNVLFLAAHPDDIEYCCPGSVLIHKERGDHIIEAVLSKGEKGAILPFNRKPNLAKRRAAELRKAAKTLGISKVLQFNIPDGEFAKHKPKIKELINRLYQEYKPKIIYLPEYKFSFYNHSDHLTLGEVGVDLLSKKRPKPSLRLYHTTKPTRLFSTKRFKTFTWKARGAHASQRFVVGWLIPILFLRYLPLYIRFALKSKSLIFEGIREI